MLGTMRTYSAPAMPRAWSRKAYDRATRYASVGFHGASQSCAAGSKKVTTAGGGLTTPTYVAAGTGAEGNPIATSPTLPTNLAGDLFVAVGGAYISDWTAPAGWTQRSGPNTTSSQNSYVWTRDARSAGSESGTVAFTPGGGSRNIIRIFSFRSVATSSFIESIVTASGASTVTNPTVTPGAASRLGVLAWVGFSTTAPSAAVAVGTAATGGTWAEVNEFDGTNDIFYIEMQTADLTAGGAISGGTTTISGTNQAFCIGFALVGV